MTRPRALELVTVTSLLFLPLLLFAPVALGNRTLVPVDALFLFEPFRSAAHQFGIEYPHNHLAADLILENYVWKRFIVQALHDRELPLWDPYIFAGHPFLANGQHSALYPLSALFYVLPLWRAFGVFTWLQLGLAGMFVYFFARTLGIGRLGALIAGITFQFSGFMVVSVVHPMIIAGASWLAFVLAMVERVVQRRSRSTLPWVLLGALGLGCQLLAGHAENTYFVLLVTIAYIAWRLVTLRTSGFPGQHLSLASWLKTRQGTLLWLALLIGLGLALGAVQFVPLYEVVATSFRGGEKAPSLQEVLRWAYPWRRLITFAIPNFFGNPSHHGYWDVFTWRWVPARRFPDGQYIEWDVKNYVEGGAYVGLLPPLLALAAVICWVKSFLYRVQKRTDDSFTFHSLGVAQAVVPFFALLALFSLGCMYGTPVYAIVYALPFLKQSHSPFRWVFPFTLAVAILAGFGTEVVRHTRTPSQKSVKLLREVPPRHLTSRLIRVVLLDAPLSPSSLLGACAFWVGTGTLAGLLASRLLFERIEPWVKWLFHNLALASNAFPDARAFYSYEFKWIAIFGLLSTASGLVLRISLCPLTMRKWALWELLAIGVLLLDFWSFGWGTNPAVDPAPLDYTPPVTEFLHQDETLWRYATFTPPGTTKTLNANSGMLYDLQCVAGYDSLFSADYAAYMELIEPQDELPYNRIASFRQWSSLDSPLMDLLNVKYIITEVEIPNPARFRLVYHDSAVRVYQNLGALERAFTLPLRATLQVEDFGEAVQTYDVRTYVLVDSNQRFPTSDAPEPGTPAPQAITRYTRNEVEVAVQVEEASWLVLADAYFPGWKAFIRPAGTERVTEQEVEIHRVNGVFRGVQVPPGRWNVRFKYSPDSVKIGAFVSFIAGMSMLFLFGLYLWRFLYRQEDETSTVRRVAKNSVAPIVINLFTRSIEMAFAALMARILGPVGNGRYATAVNIYLWFDIIANFGLDMVLIREVARDRACGYRLVTATTLLRLLLFWGTAPLLAMFLTARQAIGHPLAAETVWAVVLLYVGLLPGSLANGLAALFRACERHEIPAAVQTVTTIIKVTLGVLVLVVGAGIAGLAAASIVTNLATLAVLATLARRILWASIAPPKSVAILTDRWFEGTLLRTLLLEAWPLMAALLLQALFPGVNVLLLQSLQGDAAVGWYDAARKWVDALQIVPSFFTFAVFPVVSRQAAQDPSALRRSYILSVKLLTLLTLPVAVYITLLARPLVAVLSGQQFLPQGAEALELLIWSIVFGWINSLTNYVLIALGRQRYVLLASGVRVVFTIFANLFLVEHFSYMASAGIIVAGELLLMILFAIGLRSHLRTLNWANLLSRPLIAGAAMGSVAWGLAKFNTAVALLVSLLAYAATLWAVRVFTREEWDSLSALMPTHLRWLHIHNRAASRG